MSVEENVDGIGDAFSGTSDALFEALNAELAMLDERIEQIDRDISDYSSRIESLQIERSRYDSSRNHVEALLNRQYVPPQIHIEFESPVSEEDQITIDLGNSLSPRGLRGNEKQGMSIDRRADRGKNAFGNRKGVSIAGAVFDILKGREQLPLDERAVHYRDLVPAIEDLGIFISGRDPALNLIAHIHKDERFMRPKRGFYGLTEWYPDSTQKAGARKVGRGR